MSETSPEQPISASEEADHPVSRPATPPSVDQAAVETAQERHALASELEEVPANQALETLPLEASQKPLIEENVAQAQQDQDTRPEATPEAIAEAEAVYDEYHKKVLIAGDAVFQHVVGDPPNISRILEARKARDEAYHHAKEAFVATNKEKARLLVGRDPHLGEILKELEQQNKPTQITDQSANDQDTKAEAESENKKEENEEVDEDTKKKQEMVQAVESLSKEAQHVLAKMPTELRNRVIAGLMTNSEEAQKVIRQAIKDEKYKKISPFLVVAAILLGTVKDTGESALKAA